MPGPLPKPDAARRNKPTIPTTRLPLGGRPGRAPAPPVWVELGQPGLLWWAWAWKLPQACGWSNGDEVMIARRASLEDDLAAMHLVYGLSALDVVGGDADVLKDAVRALAGLAGGRLSVMREIRELDDRLGLTPKGLAALRWTIVDDQPKVPAAAASKTARTKVADLAERRRRISDAS